MRAVIDNIRESTSNWLASSGHTVHSGGVAYGSQNVKRVASEVGADFHVTYEPSGYMTAYNGFRVPRYKKGAYEGEPLDRYVVRADTGAVLGNHSGKYPERDGYSHVFDTLEELFPDTCESITVFGDGERLVVEQALGEPIDLDHGGGDSIQPFIYTRMSLNGTWKTEIIPVQRRVSCENMLTHAKGVIGVKATKNHDVLLTMRADVLEQSILLGEQVKRMARILVDQEFTNKEFVNLVDSLLPMPDADASMRTVNLWNEKRAAVAVRWRNERTLWGNDYGESDGSGNMWLAYNAVQGAEQHHINAGFKYSTTGKERSLVRTLDGKTPLADSAERYLMNLALGTASV